MAQENAKQVGATLSNQTLGVDHLICQGGGKRFKINYCGILKQLKNTYSISFLSCTTFREAKTICIVYHWGKNPCTGQILHSPPPPPKKTICLVYHWGKNFCIGQILHSPPPPPKKVKLVIVLTVIAALMFSRTKKFYFNPRKYMCAFWQFVLRSTSKP